MKTIPQKSSYKILLWFAVLILVAGLLSGCGLDFSAQAQGGPTQVPVVTQDPQIIAEGMIVPRDSSWLSFGSAGKIAGILVEEGQQVQQGEQLARLGNQEQAEAALAAAELELLDAQQALDSLNRKALLATSQSYMAQLSAQRERIEAQEALEELDTDSYSDDIDQAREDVVKAQEALDDAHKEMDKYAGFSEDNPNRKKAKTDLEEAEKNYDQRVREYELLVNNLEQTRASLALAEENLNDLSRDYEARQTGPDPDQLALAESRLRNAQAQLAAAQSALDNLELIAPFDGTIVEIEISRDEWVSPQQPAILLADFSEWYVKTNDLTEMDVIKIDPSKKVLVLPDALPEVELRGQVEKIADVFAERRGDITYEVKIRLDEGDDLLRWGMTVQVHFQR
jgi:multidrug efflux pump subunit AcrA (membrane-fusion protein)